MAKIVSNQKSKKEISEREKFLLVYSEFTQWIYSIGFREGHYVNESATSLDVYYKSYEKYIDALYGVEHYVNDILKISIRLLRDKHTHKIMFVNGIKALSGEYSIDEAKKSILTQSRLVKEVKLAELMSLSAI